MDEKQRELKFQRIQELEIDLLIRSWVGKTVQCYGPDAVHLGTGLLKHYDGDRMTLVTESGDDWHVFPCQWVSIRRVEESQGE